MIASFFREILSIIYKLDYSIQYLNVKFDKVNRTQITEWLRQLGFLWHCLRFRKMAEAVDFIWRDYLAR
jgi:hypothetical protein